MPQADWLDTEDGKEGMLLLMLVRLLLQACKHGAGKTWVSITCTLQDILDMLA
jgi:hypothetical protein